MPAMFTHRFLLSIAAICAAPTAWADSADVPASTIRVSGQGTARSQPDRVELQLGVVTRAPTASKAAASNARQAKQVMTSLRAMLGQRDTIETVSYTLQPELTHPEPRGEPKLAGYRATNIVRVTLDDIARTGEVIDAAVEAGADKVYQVQFTLKDESAARKRALQAAVHDARAKADTLAHSLGVRIRGVHSITAIEPMPPRPMYEASLARASATTPIAPGAIETTATVRLTLDIGESVAGRQTHRRERSSNRG